MGCSNARLLVQAPLNNEPVPAGNPSTSPNSLATESHNTGTSNATTRMHLTGVDLVVERNGSYTLLLTPKTHKQLMPYVLRKKRFRILVDKSRSNLISSSATSNEPGINEKAMETNTESKVVSTRNDEEKLEQMATEELHRTETKLLRGRSIDRGPPGEEELNIESDDEGMIEEIITTVEEDKDLECKVKTKIETKKTIAQDPETHNKITKVVKTEVKEITRTITLNDSHDLERAKRELGIDDVNRYLPPTSTWTNEQTRSIEIKEQQQQQNKDLSTSTNMAKTFVTDDKTGLAEATSVGRGAVVETIPAAVKETITAVPTTSIEAKKKKKKKSKLCSCTRAADDEVTRTGPVSLPEEKTKAQEVAAAVTTTAAAVLVASPTTNSFVETSNQGQTLISSDIKQLIIDKKQLLIDYMHSTVFSPAKLTQTDEEDVKSRKISSRILDLLRYNRCSSWDAMAEQIREEYLHPSSISRLVQPMVKTYENLFTQKSSHLLNTFSTIHQANDLQDIAENQDYLTIVQTSLDHQRASADDQEEIIVEQKEEQPNVNDDEKVINEENLPDSSVTHPVYDEEQLSKMLADVQIHKPITLAEAIAYHYIDIEDPKLGLSYDTVQRMKNLFRPLTDENLSNVIRVKRSGEYLTDLNLAENNPFEKFNQAEPLIYQLQSTFEPTLDFNEKQFRLLTEMISNHKEQYDQYQFDIARTALPVCDLKESSVNDFSQSDSGYSMTTATYESLASKIKIEFEPINQDLSVASKAEDLHEEEKIDLDRATPEQLAKYRLTPELIQIIKSDFDGSEKTVGQAILSRELRLDTTDSRELNAFGIGKEHAEILAEFFFPKQTRIIAYSPSPGRFVEAQTTYNPDYPTHKIDTTIIQIQEKQLSADPLSMQRPIHDDRPSPIATKSVQESELLVSSPSAASSTGEKKDKSPPSTPIYIKKRKSTSGTSLLSCFRSKKPKPATEQQGQPTIAPRETTTAVATSPVVISSTESKTEVPEKTMVNYGILPDGRRIYIDSFRDRPGMDMSYQPADFDQRFVLPQPTSSIDYERSMLSETESTVLKSDATDDNILPSHPEPIQQQLIEETPKMIEPVVPIASETIVPVLSEPEKKSEWVPIAVEKTEVITTQKKPLLDLHAPSVELPHVDLVQPGPLPRLSLSKRKQSEDKRKSAAGLCAACFGGKSAAKRKKPSAPEPIPAPIETKVTVEEEKVAPAPPPITSSEVAEPAVQAPNFPRVNIDVFRERNFQKGFESVTKVSDQSTPVNNLAQTSAEAPTSIPSDQSVSPSVTVKTTDQVPTAGPTTKMDYSKIFASVNIDNFRERNFQKGTIVKTPVTEEVPSPSGTTTVTVDVEPEPRETTITVDVEPEPKDTTIAVDTEPEHKETAATADAEPEPTEIPLVQENNIEIPEEKTEEVKPPSEQVETVSEPLLVQSSPTELTDSSVVQPTVNIDTFQERTFEQTTTTATEDTPKQEEQLEVPQETSAPAETIEPTAAPVEEPHYEIPQNEISRPITPPPSSAESPVKETSNLTELTTDEFSEQTLEKSSEVSPVVEEAPLNIPPTEEPHYQSPTSEPLPPAPKPVVTPSSNNDGSTFSRVNIDNFRERTFPIPTAKPKKAPEPVEEPHYQQPINEPVVQAPPPVKPPIDGTSVFSRVNIDVFRERTYPIPSQQKTVKQEASSLTTTTYDVPRSIVPEQNTPIVPVQVKEETTIPQIEPVKEPTVNPAPMPEPTKSKPTKKKSKFLSNLFRTKVPALNLPPVDRDLTPNNPSRPPHRRESDPLRVPNLTLPQPDVQLPYYDRPEANMKTGHLSNKSEFAVPAIQLPVIDNLDLPQTENKPIASSSDQMKIPHVHLPEVQYQLNQTQRNAEIPRTTAPLIESSPISIEKTEPVELPLPKPQPLTIEEKYSITDTRFVDTSETPILPEKPVESLTQRSAEFQFALPPAEPVPTLTKGSIPVAPSFDDDVPSPPSKIVPAAVASSSTLPTTTSKVIETKKSSTFPLCSCFGRKSGAVASNEEERSRTTIVAPKTELPSVDMPLPSNPSKSLNNEIFRAPSANLPPLDLTAKQTDNVRLPSLSSFRSKDEKPVESVQSAASIDVNNQLKMISSRSDSGLEATVSSTPLPASSTIGEIPQYPSVSSGFVSLSTVENLPSDQWNRVKTVLIDEISNSSNDRKSTEKIVDQAIEWMKEKKTMNFNDLETHLNKENADRSSLVDQLVRSLRYTIEKQGLDNVDKPEFPLAIRDLLHLPGKTTSEPVVSLGTTNMPKTERKSSITETTQTCFSCNRSKASKSDLAASSSTTLSHGLLDERRRGQVHHHRQELIETIRDQIQSNQPTVQRCLDHPKEIEKIVRKTLILISQPKTLSYEQVRHELKSEYKQTFHLVDPIVDIIRDTVDHCDLTQINDKTNLDILKSHICQSAQLYNNEVPLLSKEEHQALKNHQLNWLESYLIEQESKEKKLTRKKNKELQRILHRALEILSLQSISTWEELNSQLQREFNKAQDVSHRVVELLRQGHRDGLFTLQQAPTQNKRRPSSLITERAKVNLKNNRSKISLSLKKFFQDQNKLTNNQENFDLYLKKIFDYLEESQTGQFKDYNDLKEQLKKDFPQSEDHLLLEQLVDVIEQAHVSNQFDDLDKAEVQALMIDRLNGKPLVIKEMYVSLPGRLAAFGSSTGKNSNDDSSPYSSTTVNGERTLNNGNNRNVSHRIGRGLSWREANERARILFYRGKHPAIHYDEQSAAFDVRMLLETASGGTQEIPVTDSDVHELLNSCGVQWDGVNIISLVDHSEDVVRAAEQAALKVIREKGLVDLRTPLTSSTIVEPSHSDEQQQTSTLSSPSS